MYYFANAAKVSVANLKVGDVLQRLPGKWDPQVDLHKDEVILFVFSGSVDTVNWKHWCPVISKSLHNDYPWVLTGTIDGRVVHDIYGRVVEYAPSRVQDTTPHRIAQPFHIHPFPRPVVDFHERDELTPSMEIEARAWVQRNLREWPEHMNLDLRRVRTGTVEVVSRDGRKFMHDTYALECRWVAREFP